MNFLHFLTQKNFRKKGPFKHCRDTQLINILCPVTARRWWSLTSKYIITQVVFEGLLIVQDIPRECEEKKNYNMGPLILNTT